VPVYSGGGFDGLKAKRKAAERAAARTKPTLVLHIGDRDPHGEMIFTAAWEDAEAWFLSERAHTDCHLEFERLALTIEQAQDHGLLDADGKAEADALPVAVLDQIIVDRLTDLFDPAAQDRMQAEERAERAALPLLIREALTGLLSEGDDGG
jgi:hypothetical protein